jgi:hypothetical protein
MRLKCGVFILVLTKCINSFNQAGYSIATDTDGNLYVMGKYTSSSPVNVTDMNTAATAGVTRFQLPASSSPSFFLVVYDANWQAKWWTTWGVIGGTAYGYPNSITVSASGSIYVCGVYSTGGGITVPIRDLSSTSVAGVTRFSLPNTSGADRGFILKFNKATGQALAWSEYGGSFTGVYVDVADNVYVTGRGSAAPVQNMSTTNTTVWSSVTVSHGTAILVKYDSAGLVSWGVSVGRTHARSHRPPRRCT